MLVERGTKRVFASALEWPGWCRSGKTEEEALAALEACAPRYAEVAEAAGLPFDVKRAVRFEVVERLKGNTTTDFGAPDAIAERERTPFTAGDAERVGALLSAAWHLFDATVERSPASLRKGPRGGGRDRDKMVEHVDGAEQSYATTLGIRASRLGRTERHEAIVAAFASTKVPASTKGWPPRYTARRMAWHVVDHIWEMRDRVE